MPPSTLGLSEPTEALALESFERVLGSADAQRVWEQACSAAGFSPPRPPLTPPQLRVVAEHLAGQEGFVGVMGTSLRIRIETFTTLSSSWGGVESGPGDGEA